MDRPLTPRPTRPTTQLGELKPRRRSGRRLRWRFGTWWTCSSEQRSKEVIAYLLHLAHCEGCNMDSIMDVAHLYHFDTNLEGEESLRRTRTTTTYALDKSSAGTEMAAGWTSCRWRSGSGRRRSR